MAENDNVRVTLTKKGKMVFSGLRDLTCTYLMFSIKTMEANKKFDLSVNNRSRFKKEMFDHFHGRLEIQDWEVSILIQELKDKEIVIKSKVGHELNPEMFNVKSKEFFFKIPERKKRAARRFK